MRISKILLASALLAGVGANPAVADTFRLTVAAGQTPQALPSLAAVQDFFVPEVKRRLEESGSEHKVVFQEAYAGSLLKAGTVLQGVADGIADIGYVPSIFHPDKLPLEQVSFVTPFCTTDVAAVTGAMGKLYEDIPAMAGQYDKFNQIRLAGTGVDSYELLSSEPIRSFEDLRGTKIGTAGAATAWMKGIDVVPVQSNMMEYYNSTQSGVYDAFIIMPSTMPGMRYAEVAPYVTEVKFGAMYAAVLTINKNALARLPEEVQKIILEVGQDYGKVADKAYETAGEKAFDVLAKMDGTERIAYPDEDRRQWAQDMDNLAKEWAAAQDKAGLPGTEVLNGYMDALRAAGVTCERAWDKE
ncbi:C4-dicarboxylate TRAP transporter substrate-binding protein [Amorphus sp. 3PC139-8]|uniref:C4-dicarboxylate TRAP transporter substrate-binding protein n=1 Tax=Amorphus sp. 3PC139-8 TaxID=2735676 RepID=UPI00345DD31A